MTEFSYQSTPSTRRAVGVKSGDPADLKRVAECQKGILICILVIILAAASTIAWPPELRPLLQIGVLTVNLVAMMFLFLLASKIYSMALAVVLAILTIIPCLGLLVLLIVNQRATKILRENGIKVGLMGARISEI